MAERFISEPIKPVAGTMDASSAAQGEPAFPRRFIWRGKEYAVETLLEKWKQTSACSHGSAEQYLRKHWFRVRTAGGEEMKIYFQRQATSGRTRKSRWWLYTVSAPQAEDRQPDAS